MSQATWSPEAEHDLEETAFYIAVKDGRSATADRIVREVHELCDLIATQPEMGESRPQFGTACRVFSIQAAMDHFVPSGGRRHRGAPLSGWHARLRKAAMIPDAAVRSSQAACGLACHPQKRRARFVDANLFAEARLGKNAIQNALVECACARQPDFNCL